MLRSMGGDCTNEMDGRCPGQGDSTMMSKIKSLNELFEIELRYAYDCERKLAEKGLPAMIDAAHSPELRSALQHHLQETQNQVTRLENVFSIAGVKPNTKD